MKVSIDNEERYLIEFPVGDWSRDGHGKCDSYIISSKRPLEYVKRTHLDIQNKTGINLGGICREYEEDFLTKEITDKLKEVNYPFNEYVKFNSEGEPTYLTSKEVIDIWLFLLNKTDSTLGLECLKIPSITDDILSIPELRYPNDFITPGYGIFK